MKKKKTMNASGYKFLWIQVIFDLPVTTKSMRKEAVNFRKSLLDLGFYMCQLSVYMKWCISKDASKSIINKIGQIVPSNGSVYILIFTDKQYEKIITFKRKKGIKSFKNPSQYELF